MPTYIVAKGQIWGVNNDPAGTVVELSEEAAAGFVPWKLREVKITDPPVEDERIDLRFEYDNEPDDEVLELEEWSDDSWFSLSPHLIEMLEAHSIYPDNVGITPDETILSISGIGQGSLNKIRALFPKE